MIKIIFETKPAKPVEFMNTRLSSILLLCKLGKLQKKSKQ